MILTGEAYKRIFGRRKPFRSGKYVLRDGELVPARPCDLREHDATNIRSISSGVSVEQVGEMDARFGDLGVRYDPATGDAIYKDRQAKLRVMKTRGYFDRDELKG